MIVEQAIVKGDDIRILSAHTLRKVLSENGMPAAVGADYAEIAAGILEPFGYAVLPVERAAQPEGVSSEVIAVVDGVVQISYEAV